MNTPSLSVRDVPPRAAFALEQAGVHPLLARLFAARGVKSAAELDDGLNRLLAPSGLKGAVDAGVLLAEDGCALGEEHVVTLRHLQGEGGGGGGEIGRASGRERG